MFRQAVRRNPNKLPTGILESIPAPDEGWDAVSPLTDMDPKRAIIIDNLTPRPGYLELRKGSFSWATGLGGNVETLLVWRGSTEKMFGAAAGTIWDITATGAASATTITGQTNDRYQSVNFSNTAGNFIVAVNGADPAVNFDGTTWATSPAITGVSSGTLIDIWAHKKRLYFVQKDSLKVWYLSIAAIGGAAQQFDLGPIFTEGGTILCTGTWTFDGGNGVDDYWVVITDQGEVAIYQGDDPASASTWALVGTYRIGFPLSRRSILKTGGDLAVITSDGIVPLSAALRTDRTASGRIALSARIQNEFVKAVSAYKSNFGWDGLSYPKGNLAIFNIPVVGSVLSYQYVVNVLTGAWGRWLGQNAFCWEIFNDRLYFGAASGIVFEADKGSTDNGTAITADLKCAFNYFKRHGQRKKFTMIRPIIRTDSTVMPAIEMNVDYEERVPTATPTVTLPTATGLWDVGLWDVATWGDSLVVRNDWTGCNGIGVCGAVRMRIIGTAGSASIPVDTIVQVIGFDVIYESGGYV